jgi:hypothetical protein
MFPPPRKYSQGSALRKIRPHRHLPLQINLYILSKQTLIMKFLIESVEKSSLAQLVARSAVNSLGD